MIYSVLSGTTWSRRCGVTALCCWVRCSGQQRRSLLKRPWKTRTGKSLLPVLGIVAGILAYARHPQRLKKIQQLIRIQFRMGGLKRNVYHFMSESWYQSDGIHFCWASLTMTLYPQCWLRPEWNVRHFVNVFAMHFFLSIYPYLDFNIPLMCPRRFKWQ